MHIDSGLGGGDKIKVKMGFFKCMDSMARDMRHPYIPSPTVLGDMFLDCALSDMIITDHLTWL